MYTKLMHRKVKTSEEFLDYWRGRIKITNALLPHLRGADIDRLRAVQATLLDLAHKATNERAKKFNNPFYLTEESTPSSIIT